MGSDYNKTYYYPNLYKVGKGFDNILGCGRKQELGRQAVIDFNLTLVTSELNNLRQVNLTSEL